MYMISNNHVNNIISQIGDAKGALSIIRGQAQTGALGGVEGTEGAYVCVCVCILYITYVLYVYMRVLYLWVYF